MADTGGRFVRMGPARLVPGFAYGLRTPGLYQTFRVQAQGDWSFEATIGRLGELFDAMPDAAAADTPAFGADATGSHFSAVAAAIDYGLARADMKLPDRTRAECGKGIGYLYIPAYRRGAKATNEWLAIVLDLVDGKELSEQRFSRAIAALRASRPATSNGPHLARAAFECGIAVQELPASMIQYGLGRHSAVLDSTFTQHTTRNAANVARQKQLCSMLLQRALLPAPAFEMARDADASWAAAQRLGLPVVVKPADRDGGEAVNAGLASEQGVRDAFAEARAVSENVMVEKHLDGRDYRLTTFRGRTLWVVERRPAGIEGDGSSTVADLVAATNAQPGRRDGPQARLKRLKLDDAAKKVLAEQGLDERAIPEAGRFVRLARKSNVSAGGTPVAVTQSCHPDNAALAALASAQIGLDLAGVDLILPDIARSWKETGGGICEINAMPEIGGTTSLHLYGPILQSLVGARDGHIPTLMVIGAARAAELARGWADRHQTGQRPLGLHDDRGIRIGAERRGDDTLTAFAAGTALAGDRRVAGLILGNIRRDTALNGLPVPRIDLAVLTGERPVDADGNPVAEGELAQFLSAILPSARRVLLLDGNGDAALIADLGRRRGGILPEPRDRIDRAVARLFA